MMNAVGTLIREVIETEGPIPFSRFMQTALYEPGLGYYETTKSRVGKHGDFYTSVTVGPLFGQLLAFQFSEWLSEIEGPLSLVEAGAHDAALARDILDWLRSHRPDIYARLTYIIVEPSPARKEWQRETLKSHVSIVRWVNLLSELPGIQGVIFSNELLDAFPTAVLEWKNPRWHEKGISLHAGEFCWCDLGPLPDSSRLKLPVPSELAAVLPAGFRTDFSLSAGEWWQMAARKLVKGHLLTIDYGLQDLEFLRPDRASGTLRAYHQHRLSSDILERAGEQDLTAHVRFDELIRRGNCEGLSGSELSTQAGFLTRIAERRLESGMPWDQSQTRQFQTLIHPQHLGQRFRVLLQQK